MVVRAVVPSGTEYGAAGGTGGTGTGYGYHHLSFLGALLHERLL